MSRSRRKTPITSVTKAETCAPYKRARARTERMYERNLLHDAIYGDEDAAAFLSEETYRWDEWACPRDGKQYLGDEHPELMRK